MFKALIAAALVAGAGFAPVAIASADAQQRVVVRERTTVVRERGPRFRNQRWANRRVCTTERRRGRRVQVCRTVRYRR